MNQSGIDNEDKLLESTPHLFKFVLQTNSYNFPVFYSLTTFPDI